MRVALYARVSTNGHGQDPEVQLRELRAWANGHKHHVVQVYTDTGISGTKASRPGLDQMMADAKAGKFQAIVVWKLDRLFRSLANMIGTMQQLQSWDVSLISLKESLDFSTAAGRLMFHVIAAMGEFERDIIAERIRAGLANAKSKGKQPGRKIDPKKGPSKITLWRRAKRAEFGI